MNFAECQLLKDLIELYKKNLYNWIMLLIKNDKVTNLGSHVYSDKYLIVWYNI